MLTQISDGNTETLKEIMEHRLYSEMHEYLTEQIQLNEASLIVENQDTEIFDIHVRQYYFTSGLHVDKNRNDKEYIEPVIIPEGEMKATDIKFYMSKLPIKFTSVPLNIVLDLVFKTNMKLNM